MYGASYSKYHALDWSIGKTDAEIETEIARVKTKAETHHYAWNEVGNTTDDWTRHDALVTILNERKAAKGV